MRRWRLPILFFACCCAFSDPHPPLIRDTVSEITLNITVHDRHGKPIRDLTAGDFQILDDGAPVEIESFRNVNDPDVPRLVSFVFQSFEVHVAEAIHNAISDILKSDTGMNAECSVWQIDQQLHLLHAFTKDRTALDATVRAELFGRANALKDRRKSKRALVNSNSAPDPPPPSLSSISTAALELCDEIERDRHIDPWAAGLLALIDEQAAIPGRREIFLFSEGLRGTADTEQQLRTVISHANRAGISIHTVDTSGISYRARAEAAVMMAIGQADRTSKMTTVAQPAQRMPSDPINAVAVGPQRSPEFDRVGNANMSDRESTLRELATGTAGQYIDPSDFHEAVRSAVADLASFYEITYKPKPEPFDGHFRALSIKVDRPHSVVQSRAGYFATAALGPFDLAPFEIPLAKALEKPESRRQPLLFDARLFRFGPSELQPGKITAALTVQLSLGDFQAQENLNDQFLQLHFSILALIRDSAGHTVQKLSEDVPYGLAIEKKSQIRNQTYTFERPLLLAPGDYHAEVAVADEIANTLASQSIPFSIPPPERGLGLSDLIVTKALKATPQTQEDPLRYGTEHVMPELSPVIHAISGGTVPLFITIYPDPAAQARPALGFEIVKGNKSLARVPFATAQAGNAHPVSYLALLKDDSLPPGRYTIIARVTQGAETCERRAGFTLIGSTAAENSRPQAAASPMKRITQQQDEATSTGLLPSPRLIAGVTRSDAAALSALLNGARARATAYKAKLPNFICIEVTRRYSDPSGHQAWKQKDVITELVRYQSGTEKYQTLQVNGQPVHLSRAALGGVRTSGEFGELLDAVFSPKSAAKFDWLGETALNGARVAVLKFSVSRPHSMYTLSTEDGTRTYTTAFHGLAYIATNTHIVRQISLEADGIPGDFPYRDAAISVTYDSIPIEGQRYVLPTTATLLIRQKRHSLLKNDMEFTEYRRFAASSKLILQ